MTCWKCGGSGGGPECFRCPICRGSGVLKRPRDEEPDDMDPAADEPTDLDDTPNPEVLP